MASGRRVLCMRRCTRTTSKQLAERWAKGRVHIPQSSTLANWSPRDVTAAQSRIGVLIATVNQSFPELDFERERWRGTNLCVFACGIAV